MREFQTTNEHSSCDSLGKIRRTSGSLNEGLPIKWPEKCFKENDIYSMKEIVGSTLDLSAKVFFSH